MFHDLRQLFRDRQFQSIAITQFLNVGSSSLLNPVLPLYLTLQGMPPSRIGLVMGIAAAGALLMRPWAGRSVDRRGSRPVLFWGQVLMALCFIAYTQFVGFAPMLVVRFLHGVAMSFLGTASVTFASCVGTPELTASSISLYTVFTMIGLGGATSIAPLLFERVGFFPLAALSFIAVVCGIVVMWFWACDIPPVHAAQRLPFLTVMRLREVWAPTVCIFACSFIFSAAMIFVPLFALAEQLDSYWWFYVCFAISVVATRLSVRLLNDLMSTQKLATYASLLNLVSVLIIAAFPAGWSFGLAGIMMGLGFGVIFPALTVFVVERVEPSSRGTALSILTAAGDVGNALGASFLGVVAELWGYPTLFVLAAMVVLVSTLYFYKRLGPEGIAGN